MNRVSYKVIGSILLILSTILFSCKTKQTAIGIDKVKKPKQLSLKKLENKIINAYLDYDYLQLKFSSKVNFNNKKYSLKGQIRFKKDSLIWINVSHSTSIPVASIVFKKDSIIFIDKLNSMYYNGKYDFLERNFQLDLVFAQIQALLTNELFTYPDWEDVSDLKKSGYKDRIDSNMYCFKSLKDRKVKKILKKEHENDLIIQDIYIEPDSFKIRSTFINEYNLNRSLTINYNNFKLEKDHLFPQLINVTFKNDTNLLNISVKYNKITTDKQLRFPINIPRKYTRIE